MVILNWSDEPSPVKDGIWGRSRGWAALAGLCHLSSSSVTVGLTCSGGDMEMCSHEAGSLGQDQNLPSFQWLQTNVCS